MASFRNAILVFMLVRLAAAPSAAARAEESLTTTLVNSQIQQLTGINPKQVEAALGKLFEKNGQFPSADGITIHARAGLYAQGIHARWKGKCSAPALTNLSHSVKGYKSSQGAMEHCVEELSHMIAARIKAEM